MHVWSWRQTRRCPLALGWLQLHGTGSTLPPQLWSCSLPSVLVWTPIAQSYLPFLKSESVSHLVMPNSLWPHGLYLTGSSVHGLLQAI